MPSFRSNTIRPVRSKPASTHRADIRFASRRRRSGSRAAFSLLELLIVLAIMAAMTGIGVLRYARSLTRYRTEAAAARVVADLRAAQAAARTTGTTRTVRFDPATASYGIYTAAQLAANTPGSVVSLADSPYRASLRLDGLVGQAVAFDGRGEGNQGGVIVLTCGSAEKAVIVEPSYGRAYVAGSSE